MAVDCASGDPWMEIRVTAPTLRVNGHIVATPLRSFLSIRACPGWSGAGEIGGPPHHRGAPQLTSAELEARDLGVVPGPISGNGSMIVPRMSRDHWPTAAYGGTRLHVIIEGEHAKPQVKG